MVMGQRALDDFIQLDSVASSEDELYEKIGSQGQREYLIEGISVKFPFEAYPCQMQMMENIIKALNGNKNNALLESPTGSGKSLALLCSVLGWLENRKSVKRNEILKAMKEASKISAENEKLLRDIGYATPTDENCLYASNAINVDSDEDFMLPMAKRAKEDPGLKELDTKVTGSLPKIFITSRTHRQIAQLVRELDRCSYSPKFVVLGSRSHYCINDVVRNTKDKDINEGCRDVTFSTNGPKCFYYEGYMKALKSNSIAPPNCDIEDLVKKGRKEKICPYYSSRAALEQAEVIFGPYNYLIDPLIRDTMGIELDQDIIIIDEAHNTEDVCRDAGSFDVTDDMLAAIAQELQVVTHSLEDVKEDSKSRQIYLAHITQGHVLSIIYNWLKNSQSNRGTIRKDFETVTTAWEGQSIIEELSSLGITYGNLTSWNADLLKITDNINESPAQKSQTDSNRKDPHYLSFGSCQVLRGLYFSMTNILRENSRYVNSYRMVRYQSTKMENHQRKIVFTLGFWCLNPEVIFKSMINETKSVILTSGTLSPMDTFSSELGIKFENKLEALHIIDDDQTWVGCIPVGPSGTTFLGNFKTMDSYEYQDDLGRAILEVVKVVSAGILCFVPSYSFLDKLVKRMEVIGIYKEISKRKKIFLEPRNGTPKDFEKLLKNYYKAVKEHSGKTAGVNGALLFAVYRGKISEGLDLKDDNCRAVISVGIPYPAFKDPKVILKREFNDKNKEGITKLSGQHWYESQAFRALNQALGRCIRHRNDWGAIILLEQRFTFPKNTGQLSKWVRSRVKQHRNFDLAMSSLSSFVNHNSNKSIQ